MAGDWELIELVLALVLVLIAWFCWPMLRKGDGISPPEGQSCPLGLGDETIYYYRIGKGPPLILLHGLAASSYCWRFLVQLLKDRFTIYALDQVGFGQSSKPAAADYGL